MNLIHVVADVRVEVGLNFDHFLAVLDDESKLCFGLSPAVSLVSGVIHNLHCFAFVLAGVVCFDVVIISIATSVAIALA